MKTFVNSWQKITFASLNTKHELRQKHPRNDW
jgi:hypothetical protein